MTNAFKKTILGMVGSKVAELARVADVQSLSEHFRLIDMEVDPANLAGLGPVDKAKINTGEWDVRTYTPVLQPHYPGRLRLLIYLHGNGPGSRWAAALKEGDTSHLIGPKAALQVGHEPFVLVGDETSFATALNFKTRRDVHGVFEATHPQEAQQVLAALGLRNASVIAKAPQSTHRDELHRAVQQHMQSLQTQRAVLTGHAQTIQHVGRALKLGGVRPDIMTKPHWANHKEGLD